jgi:hypothetical protein
MGARLHDVDYIDEWLRGRDACQSAHDNPCGRTICGFLRCDRCINLGKLLTCGEPAIWLPDLPAGGVLTGDFQMRTLPK